MARWGRLCLAAALMATNVACARLFAQGDQVTGALETAAVVATPDQAALDVPLDDPALGEADQPDAAVPPLPPRAGQTRMRVAARGGPAPARGDIVDYLASMNRILDRHSTDARHAVRSMCEGC